MVFDKAESAAWETHLLGIWGASGLSCSQGGLAGDLGCGPFKLAKWQEKHQEARYREK